MTSGIKKNSVFIATSLDGYIADKNNEIDWLYKIPNPNNEDMGYLEFINNIDAIVMGRKTFETVYGFDIDWPYKKPVFILSNTLNEVPESHKKKVFLIKGTLAEIIGEINKKGFNRLYIDGGTTIRGFLRSNFIDEITITIIPILLGGGSPLFTELPKEVRFELVKSKIFLKHLTQNCYRLKK